MEQQQQPSSGAQELENIEKTVSLFDDIYKVVKDPRFSKEFDADERHRVLLQKYKDIANMYPVVLRIMARDLRYNSTALRKMLEKLLKDQKRNAEENAKKASAGNGKKDSLAAMKAFITHQSDYAKFLYLEETKKAGRHINMKTANAIWRTEYGDMSKALKKIKEDEDKARNEFEDEKKKHLTEKKQELLDFVLANAPNDADDDGEGGDEGDGGGSGSGGGDDDPVQRELEELGELSSYLSDLEEAYKSFKNDDTVVPGISNEDIQEYSLILSYCRKLFDLAVKHEKMSQDDRDSREKEIIFCIGIIDKEVVRRNKIAHKAREDANNEWLEGLIPKKKTASGSVSKKGSGKGSGSKSGKAKGNGKRG
jgi:hypothetical protein